MATKVLATAPLQLSVGSLAETTLRLVLLGLSASLAC